MTAAELAAILTAAAGLVASVTALIVALRTRTTSLAAANSMARAGTRTERSARPGASGDGI